MATSRWAARQVAARSSDLFCPPGRPSRRRNAITSRRAARQRANRPRVLFSNRRGPVSCRMASRKRKMSAPNKNYDPVAVTTLSAADVERALDAALAAIGKAKTLDELKEARLAHDGDKAPLRLARAEIGALPPEARAAAGRRVGAAMARVAAALNGRQAELENERDEQVLVTERVDVTLPYDRIPQGGRHPVTMTADRLADVFVAMGYEVAEGPEVEAEWYNFDALNIPPDHPAREMQDTLFIASPPGTETNSGIVLRTHTSPVLTRPLPLYVVSPGKVYRNEALDATHLPVFYQIEGLAVDEGLTMADLRGAIQAF